MEEKSKNIIDLYVAANENKHIIAKRDLKRDFSVAELTVLACLDALFRYELNKREKDYDVHKVIRMILLDSLGDKTNNLSGKHKFDDIYQELNNMSSEEARQARISTFNTAMGFVDENESLNEILNIYSKLQTQLRAGHILWGAKGERLESDLEHTYGTLVLALGLESEYDYYLDYDKLLTTLLIHETDEIELGDKTDFDGYTREERLANSKTAEGNVLSRLPNGKYYINLLDEFNKHDTIISEYAHLIDKLEFDMQIKMYDMEGRFDFANRPVNNCTTSPVVLKIIENGANSVSEVLYEYDKDKYHSLPCMRRLLEHTRNL